MTSRERILTAIRHQDADRVPVSPRIWAFLRERYGSSNPLLELHAARDFGYDPMLVMGTGPPNYLMRPIAGEPPFIELGDVRIDLTVQGRGETSEVRRVVHTPVGALTSTYMIGRPGQTYGINPNYHHLEYMIKSPDDLEKVAYLLPDPESVNPREYHAVAEVYGEDGLVFARPTAGVDHFLVDSFGLENLAVLYLDDRAFFTTALDFFQGYYRRMLTAHLERGVRFIFESWYNFSMSAGWSPKMYREMIIPCIRANAELIHSYDGVMFFYDDGKMMEVLPDLVEAGIDIIETLTPPPIGDVDLRRAKEIARGRSCMKGNIDIVNVIKLGTPDLVEEKVAEALDAAKDGGGFILSTSDSIRDGSPIENVRRFFEAGKKYGAF